MKISIPRQIQDALGPEYLVKSSEYDDGPPFRTRILKFTPKQFWFIHYTITQEVAYYLPQDDEVISSDPKLLKLLQQKIPNINCTLV